MSHISEEEKFQQIDAAFHVDDLYLRALDKLKEDLMLQGIDVDTVEGRKTFIHAVRKLNESFYESWPSTRD